MPPLHRAPPPRLPSPCRPEQEAARAAARLIGPLDWAAVTAAATPWVQAVRAQPAPFWALESLLLEYPLSSEEGLALMRLAEALLRVPDIDTAIALTADQLARADFAPRSGDDADIGRRVLGTLSASAIALSRNLLHGEAARAHDSLLERLGARVVVGAAVRAMQLLGRQFVLAGGIDEAVEAARAQRQGHAALRFSFDALGEGARSDADARRYLEAYAAAIARLGREAGGRGPDRSDGISIKLSALFARYEESQRDRVLAELVPRAEQLCEAAAHAEIQLTVDAEESERLELSLDVFDALAARVAARYRGWRGLGLAVQAYQTRSLETVRAVADIGARHGLRLMVRLVKGAYWDTEIKRAQELGLPGYPVFTRKDHTDVAYLACARALLQHAAQDGSLYPQFATHNAATIAAVLQMARDAGTPFEMQRLHGMGEAIYREVLRSHPQLALRVYAPIGAQRDLLAYLVRRLLENGANSSFVRRLAEPGVGVAELLRAPTIGDHEPGPPLPRELYAPVRANAAGLDLSSAHMRVSLDRALAEQRVEAVRETPVGEIDACMCSLHAAAGTWNAHGVEARAAVLERAADLLEADLAQFCALVIREGRRTPADALAEVREAIDFCRYYAAQAREQLAPHTLPGPTGERNELRMRGRGVFVCISPWNFPLAIFTGQVAAALVAGNAVAAKPAEQTPAIALRVVRLLYRAGVPREALVLVHGAGERVGAALVAHRLTAGVCFTGSTEVARHVARALASKEGPIVPLIAETGGLNAMIVDSSALAEQVVDAVVQSAFRSAGQRCSALRLLVLHESIAQAVIDMLAGAMAQLRVGDADVLATDVGPLIDHQAHARIAKHVVRLEREATLLARSPLPADAPRDAVAPVMFEIAHVSDLREEIFGPVLHVVRWRGEVDAVVSEINALGYGLTLGIQTRIDSRAERIAACARVGNVYVNRNMIGAVVGVQPFGGQGLSGSGPKAGGPHYLPRLCAEQTFTVNSAAAGGNIDLLAGE